MKKGLKIILAVVLVMSMMFSMVACSKKPVEEKPSSNTDTKKTDETKKTTEDPVVDDGIDRSELITLDFFANGANYQGIQGGWFGKIIKDKFNIELNIIAPNVAGGGDALYQTRAAEGNLGDIISISKDKMLDCIEAGIILDITDMYNNSKNLIKFDAATKSFMNYAGTDRVYAIGTNVSTETPMTPKFEANSPYVASFMRLDLYNQLGNPEMKTSADMLNVLKQMQEINPVADNGKKTYAFSLFGDWDGGYMTLASKFAFMYGYEEGKTGFCFVNADATSYQHVAEDNGVYYNALKLLYDANKLGLVDPDSSSQNWDTVWNKMAEGQTLFSFWPWHAGAFNTLERRHNGMGMGYIPVGDQVMVNEGHNIYGVGTIAIGSKTKYPERVFEFLDWMATSEFVYYTEQSNAGIKGVTWDIVDGRPALTELGKTLRENPDAVFDQEYGGGTLRDGQSKSNTSIIMPIAKDPETGESFSVDSWTSVIEENQTQFDKMYVETFGALNGADYLLKNNLVTVAIGADYTPAREDSETALMRTQCGEVIRQASWKLIFAKNDAEFNSIWENMKSQLDGFGYEEVLAFDLKNVEALRAARAKALADSK